MAVPPRGTTPEMRSPWLEIRLAPLRPRTRSRTTRAQTSFVPGEGASRTRCCSATGEPGQPKPRPFLPDPQMTQGERKSTSVGRNEGALGNSFTWLFTRSGSIVLTQFARKASPDDAVDRLAPIIHEAP